MATPTPTDDVVIKSTNSDAANEEQAMQQDEQPVQEEEDVPAVSPLSTQEQLQAMARRREAAVSFRNQVGECRLALRYSVIGWTGTLDPVSRRRPLLSLPVSSILRNASPLLSPTYLSIDRPILRIPLQTTSTHTGQTTPQDKISTALSNAPSIEKLDEEMTKLERKLAPFLPADNNGGSSSSSSSQGQSQGQGLGAEALARVERVRAQLLTIEPGIKSTRFIKPVLDSIDREARSVGILPPQDNMGWVWSLSFDDWFIWRAGEDAFVSARRGIRTDFVSP